MFAVCALASNVAWRLLRWPGALLAGVIPFGTCEQLTVGSGEMFFCSAQIAIATLIGPICLTLGLVLLRHPLARAYHRIERVVPQEWRFLVGPLAATLAFGLTWAGVHFDTGQQAGFVLEREFPGVAGLLLFLAVTVGRVLTRAVPASLRLRRRLSTRQAAIVALVIAAVFASIESQRRSDTMTEQSITVGVVVIAYLALIPRAKPRPTARV